MYKTKHTARRRALSILMTLALVLTLLPIFATPVFAASTGTFDLATGTWTSGSSANCAWNGMILTVNSGADITVTGSVSNNGRRIAVNGTAHITLSDTTIDLSSGSECPLMLNSGSNVTLTLDGVNTLKAGNFRAGIQTTGATLTIGGGTGSLTATGGYAAAGIGGGDSGECGVVNINGGTVTATGGYSAAGIGGDRPSACVTVTINGGTVNTNGGYNGAGIGGGTWGTGGTVTINGGTVNATGGVGGAGIGSGSMGVGGSITITGGNVTANGGGDSAGIGGSRSGSVDSITISGGTVQATGGNFSDPSYGGGAGIGGGVGNVNEAAPNSGTIEISGDANVTATGGNSGSNGGGAGIGTGGTGQGSSIQGSLGTITITTSGTVTATGGTGAGTPARNGAAVGFGGDNPGAGAPVLPLAPTGLTATPGGGQVTLAWTAPANISSYANPGYEVSSDGGATWVTASSSTSHTFSNLTPGTPYDFKVRATFNYGFGVETSSVSATPTAVPVTSITVNGAGGAAVITTNGGTLQMSAAVSPGNASDPTVTWSVTPGTGSATISASGLLTAVSNGTVIVVATANDGSGVTGTLVITISGQTIRYQVIKNFGRFTGSGDHTGKIDGPFGKFDRLLFEGKTVKPSNYTVSEGSTVITLKESYMKTLANGTYTFRAEFTDGYAKLKLTVDVKASGGNDSDNSGNPQTGDNSHMTEWMIVLMLSALGVLCALVWRKWRQLRGTW